jgi:hypothetical protein
MRNVAGQVVDILCRDKPDGVSDNFFKDYVEMIWYGAPRAADGLLRACAVGSSWSTS